jgi:hypothetical protein
MEGLSDYVTGGHLALEKARLLVLQSCIAVVKFRDISTSSDFLSIPKKIQLEYV